MSQRLATVFLRVCSLALFGSILSAVAPDRAFAQTAEAPDTQDAQLWTQVVATISPSENWRVHLEGQPRWADNMSELDQVILRGAIGRRVHPRLTVWGGYAFIPRTRGEGTQYEHRAWEQLSATLPDAGAWTPSLRLRLEQRFLDAWGDTSHRLRLMGRAVRPIDAKKNWSIAVWDEVMVTFDDTEAGPWQGVDQNRLFAGIIRKLTDEAALETGYLWQTMDQPGASLRRHSHVAFVWLNLTL